MEIIAHRGASQDAPENTVAAARLAWRQGADAVECDVRLTSDRRLAVVHDPDTGRTAGRKLVVRRATLAGLRQLDVGSRKGGDYPGERIPELRDLVREMPPGRRLFVEIKGGKEAALPLADCVRESGLRQDRFVVIASKPGALLAAKRLLPRCETAWILPYRGLAARRLSERAIGRCVRAGIDALDLEAAWPIDRRLTERVHRRGLKLYVWTVDDSERARALAKSGVDGLTTNRPGWMRAALPNRSPKNKR